MNMTAINNGQTLHFSVRRQLNRNLERWEDLCLGKSSCHCAAADCLLSLTAAPQTSESSLLTFHSFSLSHSCTLWTLDLLHSQSGANSISPLWLQETVPSATKPWVWSARVWMHGFSLKYVECLLYCESEGSLPEKRMYFDQCPLQLCQAYSSS